MESVLSKQRLPDGAWRRQSWAELAAGWQKQYKWDSRNPGALEQLMDELQALFCAPLSEEMCLAFVALVCRWLTGDGHHGQE